MSVLVVGGTKGGSGKSTLAVNLVVARANSGKKVLLIDADLQETATIFTELRVKNLGESGYTAINLKPAGIRSETPKLARDYDDVIIDVGGRDNAPLRVSLSVCDAVLIPVQPRSVDIWDLDQMVEVIQKVREEELSDRKFRAIAVLNMADSSGRDNDDSINAMRDIREIETLSIAIGRRKSFANATGTGKGVGEFLPRDQKAIEELQILINAFKERLVFK